MKNHHHKAFAETFPLIAYVRTKTGKAFVYDNRNPHHGQMPIATIDDTHAPKNRLIHKGEVVHIGTVKECLEYANRRLLK